MGLSQKIYSVEQELKSLLRNPTEEAQEIFIENLRKHIHSVHSRFIIGLLNEVYADRDLMLQDIKCKLPKYTMLEADVKLSQDDKFFILLYLSKKYRDYIPDIWKIK